MKMHKLTTIVLLLISQYIDNQCTGTRLPLEVYELTPAAAAVATGSQPSTADTVDLHATVTANALKHKTLEYTTYDAKDLAAAATFMKGNNKVNTATSDAGATPLLLPLFSGSGSITTTKPMIIMTTKTTTTTVKKITTNSDLLSVVSISAETTNEQDHDIELEQSGDGEETGATSMHHLASVAAAAAAAAEHRKSRQMQGQLSIQGAAGQHRFGHDIIQQHLQKQQHQQQQQQQLLREENNRKRLMHLGKDVRILYQVGDSEEDLPICAPNAVCSKIDLYETPWIERQCRCPEINRMPNIVVHHHHHHQNGNKGGNGGTGGVALGALDLSADKYRAFYEKEKLLQHKRILLGDYADKKYESLHLKKLMQKLGAVYEDDLQLQPSDYLEQDYNDALPLPSSLEQDFSELSDNEFPHGPRRGGIYSGSAHMRHSGHRGMKEPMSFIGGCPSSLGIEDGHTIADKTRHYKMCQPVHKLPVCKHFRDYTWTLTTAADLNVTEQIVHCRCPKNSVTYLTKREPAGTNGYTYLFACSPLTRIRCQRKQPCKLFTVRKRQEFLDEVNINSLCQCPKGHHCPSHHTQSSVIAGESFLEDNIQTYSGYCMAND